MSAPSIVSPPSKEDKFVELIHVILQDASLNDEQKENELLKSAKYFGFEILPDSLLTILPATTIRMFVRNDVTNSAGESVQAKLPVELKPSNDNVQITVSQLDLAGAFTQSESKVLLCALSLEALDQKVKHAFNIEKDAVIKIYYWVEPSTDRCRIDSDEEFRLFCHLQYERLHRDQGDIPMYVWEKPRTFTNNSPPKAVRPAPYRSGSSHSGSSVIQKQYRSATPPNHALFELQHKLAVLQLQRLECTVQVRQWTNGEPLKFRVASFADLHDCISSSTLLADSPSGASSTPARPVVTWKLYYFPRGSATWWRDRTKVEDEATFAEYVRQYGSRPLHECPLLLLWITPANGSTVSQHRSPLKESTPPAEPLFPKPPSPLPPSSPSIRSGSSRSSTDQKGFAQAVYQRDGKRCVVCDAKQVEAAHVIPVGEERSAEGQEAAGLLMLYEPRNGIRLCTICHDYFDAGLWCIDPSGSRSSMVVATALSANDPDWAQRHGEVVRLPSSSALKESWPTKRILQVQQQFFEHKKAKRHTDVLERPHACPVCQHRFVANGAAFKLHKKDCSARAMPANFRTPVKPTKAAAAARKKK